MDDAPQPPPTPQRPPPSWREVLMAYAPAITAALGIVSLVLGALHRR